MEALHLTTLSEVSYCKQTLAMETKLEYDFLKSFLLIDNRRGRQFKMSPGLTNYVNERLDKELQQQASRTAATEQSHGARSKYEAGDETFGHI
jgi:hypothetical protein